MAVSLGINITQNSQNIAACTSNITVSVYCNWSSGSYNKNTSPAPAGWLKIDGIQYDFRNTFNDNRTTNGSKTLFSKTLDVKHDSEGIKTVYCYAYFATGVSSGDIYASNSLRLTDIPRYARIEQAPDFTDEEDPTITYANYAGDLTDDLQAAISVDGETQLVAYRAVAKDAESYTFRLTNKEREALRAATPDSNDLTVFFLMKTAIGEDVGVTTFEATMHIVNADPVVEPVIVDTNAATVAATGDASILVALHSVANVTLNAAAQKGATITSKKVEQGSLVLNGDGEFLVASAENILITVTDSRGNVSTLQAPNELVPYIDPTCYIEQTMPDGDGDMPLTIVGKAYNGTIGTAGNVLIVQYRNKAGYGEYGEWVTVATVTRTGNDFVAETTVTGLDYKARHTFQARVIDAIATDGVLSSEKVFVAVPVFDWGQDDFRFNVPVYAEKVTGLAAPEAETDAINKGYFDSEIANTEETMKALAGGKVSMTLLWENASLVGNINSNTITFASQTISLDWSKYSCIKVIAAGWNTFSSTDVVAESGCMGTLSTICANDNGSVMGIRRNVTIQSNGVYFDNTYSNTIYGQMEQNNRLVPFRIYGIDGVIA